MNIVAFIPARGGSKSIPGKNIKLLGGKPLIVWSIEDGLDLGLRTIVSTDDKKIAEIAKRNGAEVLMRPPELAQDDTPMYKVLRYEVLRINPIPDAILLLQPTSPFRTKARVRKAINIFTKIRPDCLIEVEPVPEKYNPAQVIVATAKGLEMSDGSPIKFRVTRRQAFPKAWVPTGGLYLFKTANLDHGSIYGDGVLIHEVESSININSPDDWAIAEEWLQSS